MRSLYTHCAKNTKEMHNYELWLLNLVTVNLNLLQTQSLCHNADDHTTGIKLQLDSIIVALSKVINHGVLGMGDREGGWLR